MGIVQILNFKKLENLKNSGNLEIFKILNFKKLENLKNSGNLDIVKIMNFKKLENLKNSGNLEIFEGWGSRFETNKCIRKTDISEFRNFEN